MMKLLHKRTVKARLLTLMTIVVLPVAILSIILANINYTIVSKEIEAAQLQTVSGFTVRARIVLRGSLRMLVGAIAALDALDGSNADCNIIANKTLSAVTKHPALWVRLNDQTICRAYTSEGFSDQIMADIVREQSQIEFVPPLAGAGLALTRYDSVRVNGKLYIVIYVKNQPSEIRQWEGILLMDPELMQSAFDLGTIIKGTIVAVMHSGNEPLVARLNGYTDQSWLPEKEITKTDEGFWSSPSKAGDLHLYTTRMIAEPNLYTLARFDGKASRAAWFQFMIMMLTPILIMAILAYAYAKGIQNTVIRWIVDIEIAAKSENLAPVKQKFVAIDASMPSDIGSVAIAFNKMVLDAAEREAALNETLQINTGLMRELHHRVKNSLQVIQSYIALSRRTPDGSKSTHLADAELKIQVLATAYRFALTETGIRPVYIKSFVEEIISNLSFSVRKNNQWISNTTEGDAQLSVDRIIPLGLAIIEAVSAGLRAEGAENVTVSLSTIEPNLIELAIKTDGQWDDGKLDIKLVSGLSLQLEATIKNTNANCILLWHFSI